jgi:hypothetical protein
MSGKPYSFKPSIERLLEMKDLSPKEKLDWLEEAHQLVAAFVSADYFERWQMVSSGQRDSQAYPTETAE